MTHALIQEVGSLDSADITPEHTELLMQVGASIGKKFARQYPALSADDISSEVMAIALANWHNYAKPLSKAADYGKSEAEVLRYQLSLKAREFCGKQSYRYMIENPHSLVYTPKEVRALLKEIYYDPEAYATPGRDDEMGVAVEAKSFWVNLADLNEALTRVPDKVHDTILAAFGPEDLGLDEPHPMAVSRAVDEVTKELNRHLNRGRTSNEGPGSRRALTNSTSQSIISEEN
jgi:hypothetical protein